MTYDEICWEISSAPGLCQQGVAPCAAGKIQALFRGEALHCLAVCSSSFFRTLISTRVPLARLAAGAFPIPIA